MDEKMEKALKEFLANLTDEQKEKAKECKTPEELMAFAGKEGLELPDELIEGVAGGLVPPPSYWDSIIERLEWQEQPEPDLLKEDYPDLP